jgi:hypothetical protein
MASNLSDYEKLRAQNIQKNNARLRFLGLISAVEERVSNNTALGISNAPDEKEKSDSEDSDEEEDYEDVSTGTSTGKKKRKRGKESVNGPPRQGMRKSLRLRGISCNLKHAKGDNKLKDKESIQKERMERVKECRETRLRAAKAVAEVGAEAAAKENPTATYEHCLMRVKTMTSKALVSRVRFICSQRLNESLFRLKTFLPRCL